MISLCLLWFFESSFNSESIKNVLIASAHIPFKTREFATFTSELPTLSPRTLLSGPAGKYDNALSFL